MARYYNNYWMRDIGEDLEDIIEEIWKDMCLITLVYPNDWKWIIQKRGGEEYRWLTVTSAFTSFRNAIKLWQKKKCS